MTSDLVGHLTSLPLELAEAIADSAKETLEHFVKQEWSDSQVDGGRFCEAALRYLEWKMTGSYTVIDGKGKPDRKKTVNKATNDIGLEPSLRAQVPQAIELVMDFRNSRNSAHLGNINANKMDAACVVQNVSWIAAEISRIESRRAPVDVQEVVDGLAERHVPLVQIVGDDRVVLDTSLDAAERALVLLFQEVEPVEVGQLRKWVGYENATRWRQTVLKKLEKKKYVHIDRDGNVTLLRPGEALAQRLLLDAAA